MPELDLKEAIEILKDIVKNISFRNAIQPNYEKECLCRKAIFLAISKLQLFGQLNEEKIRHIIQSHLYIEGNELMGFIEASQAIITYLTMNRKQPTRSLMAKKRKKEIYIVYSHKDFQIKFALISRIGSWYPNFFSIPQNGLIKFRITIEEIE